jgi:hypothetical protein
VLDSQIAARFACGLFAALDLQGKTDRMWDNVASFPQGPLIIAALSVAALVLAVLYLPVWAAWVVGVTGPLILAWAMYWFPVWFESRTGEGAMWANVGLTVGAIAGLLPNVAVGIVCLVASRLRPRSGGPNKSLNDDVAKATRR